MHFISALPLFNPYYCWVVDTFKTAYKIMNACAFRNDMLGARIKCNLALRGL